MAKEGEGNRSEMSIRCMRTEHETKGKVRRKRYREKKNANKVGF